MRCSAVILCLLLTYLAIANSVPATFGSFQNLQDPPDEDENRPVVEVVIFPDDDDDVIRRPWEVMPMPNAKNDTIVDPFTEEPYTEDEKKCLSQRKFLGRADGKCHTLGVRGPCAANELFVLDKSKLDENGPIRPVCKAKLCSEPTKIWWPGTSKCEDRSWVKSEHCSEKSNRALVTDSYGEGLCQCASEYGEMELGGRCFEYYQRGPCAADQVITYDVSTGFAKCSEDLCLEMNNAPPAATTTTTRRPTTRRRGMMTSITTPKPAVDRSNATTCVTKGPPVGAVTPKRKYFAPLEGTGRCLRLGSHDPCSSLVAPESRLVVATHAPHAPRCSTADVSLHLIDAPPLCRLGHDNKCREEVSVQQEDRLAYLRQLKSQLKAAKG